MNLPVIEPPKKTKPMKCGVTVCYTNSTPSYTSFDDFYEALAFAREVCGWVVAGTPNKVIFEVYE